MRYTLQFSFGTWRETTVRHFFCKLFPLLFQITFPTPLFLWNIDSIVADHLFVNYWFFLSNHLFPLTSNLSTSTSLLLLVIFLNGNLAWEQKSVDIFFTNLDIALSCTHLFQVLTMSLLWVPQCFQKKYLLCGCSCCHDDNHKKITRNSVKSCEVYSLLFTVDCRHMIPKSVYISPVFTSYKGTKDVSVPQLPKKSRLGTRSGALSFR